MSRHEIITSHSLSVTEGTEIVVPLSTGNFEQRQDAESGGTTIAVGMALAFCLLPALIIYAMSLDTTHSRLGSIFAISLSFLPSIIFSVAACVGLQHTKALKRTLAQNLPALVIDRRGSHDNCSTYAFGLIPWSEIATVAATRKTRRGRGGRIVSVPGVALVINSKASLLRGKPTLMKPWVSMELDAKDEVQVFIPQSMIACNVDELAARISEFRASLRV